MAFLSEVLARAQGLLIEPAAPATDQPSPADADRSRARPPRQLEVVVAGIARGSGASTVAGGLAACLAVPGRRVSQVVALDRDNAVAPPAGCSTALVWDARPADLEHLSFAARRADAVVLVASAISEPALSELVARTLALRLGPILLVANRVRAPGRWRGRAAVSLPESRLNATLAARARRAGGSFGAGLAELASIVERGL
jgi:hypothetical protein